MTFRTLLIVAIALPLLACLPVMFRLLGKGAGREQPRRKRVLTEREQAMYFRLTSALPDRVVLAQVSLGALLTAKAPAVRNTFSQKIADFVVLDRSMHVLAVIELDDESHKGKREKDSARDGMLRGAGYKVLRYANVPDADQVRGDMAPPAEPGPPITIAAHRP